MKPPVLPFTEQADPLTAAIDLAEGTERVRLLAEGVRLLLGVPGHPSVLDATTLDACVRAADGVRPVLQSPRGAVVLAGAGTSGRLAFLVARLLNERLVRAGLRPSIRPVIAGGPRALARSVEGAEDDHDEGQRQAAQHLGGGQDLFVGISCGLAAPWVAGGLDAALAADGTTVALLGFNPIDRARPSFRAVAERVAASPRGICILPVLGPEPIAGSTRMKGGTATLLLLCSVLEQAMVARVPDPREDMRLRMLRLELAAVPFASARLRADLAALAAAAGSALLAGRSVFYLGGGLMGWLGVIDASECPPTFGADPRQVRAFVEGGWASMVPESAPELEQASPVDVARWKEQRPRPGDLIVQWDAAGAALRSTAVVAGAAVAALLGDDGDEVTRLLRLKLALNTISTCAFVIAGKVFGNRMIDLRLSNAKLFERAVTIVADVAKVDAAAARRAVVGAIHRSDDPGGLVAAPVAQHVAAAAKVAKVVPIAILVAGAGMRVAEAERVLGAEPLVRRVLERELSGAGPEG